MSQKANIHRVIAYAPEGEAGYFGMVAPGFELLGQRGDDLGARLANAFDDLFAAGMERVVIMDSDSPTLPAHCLKGAFAALEAADVALGPCDDGGYYLIGLKRPAPRLLLDVTMSTPTVLQDTLRLAQADGLSVARLPAWYDVDTVAEMERLRAELVSLSPERATHTRKFFAANYAN